jgi:hypothetical protein
MIGKAGHALSEPGIGAELVCTMDRLRANPALQALSNDIF